MIERNCGGAFIKLWCEVKKQDVQISKKKTDLLDKNLKGYTWAHQRREQSIGGEDRWRGCLARVLGPDYPRGHDQYWLHLRSGSMEKATRAGDPGDDKVRILVPNKRVGDQEKSRKLRPWEQKEGYVHDLVCSYCSRDFTNRGTNQYSNTQTRGDQFFNAVTTLTTNLGPVASSAHLPTKVGKHLFSPIPGKALHVWPLGSTPRLRRTKGVHPHRHASPRLVPRASRSQQSLAAIYPYMCFFSGLKR